MKNRMALLVGFVSAFAIGCGSEPTEAGKGTLAVRITGEDAAKTGFPVQEDMEMVTFEDGWTLQFSKFLISVGSIDVKGADGTMGSSLSDTYVADLHAADASFPEIAALEARRWESFNFQLKAPDAGARTLGAVDSADVQAMIDGKYNYWIEGTATKATETISFAWGLANPTQNANCTNGLDNTDGVVIRANATTEAEITIHVEHLFWDTLGSEMASLRFDALAAVAGTDKKLTTGEIATQSLANLKDAQGMPLVDATNMPIVYNPGSIPLKTQDLLSFIQASGASMAHLNGEGLCTISGL